MKDDTKMILMSLGVFTIVLLIGGYIFMTMAYEIEANPDVTEIGGPPVITDIGPMFVVVLGLAFVIFSFIIR